MDHPERNGESARCAPCTLAPACARAACACAMRFAQVHQDAGRCERRPGQEHRAHRILSAAARAQRFQPHVAPQQEGVQQAKAQTWEDRHPPRECTCSLSLNQPHCHDMPYLGCADPCAAHPQHHGPTSTSIQADPAAAPAEQYVAHRQSRSSSSSSIQQMPLSSPPPAPTIAAFAVGIL